MKLRLSVTTGQNAFADHDDSHEFTELGGTIGRASRNDWVIPDPTRVVSGTHAQIDFVDGQFRLTDTSTNGVFVNGSDLALGRDNSIALATGDRLQIGDFDIAVSIEDDSAEQGAAEQLDTGLPPWPIEDASDAPSPVLPEDFAQSQPYWGATESDQVPDVYGNLADLGSIGTGAADASPAEWDFSDLDPDALGAPTGSDQAPGDSVPEGIWPDSASGPKTPERTAPGVEQAGPLADRPSEAPPAEIGTDLGQIAGAATAFGQEGADQTGHRPASDVEAEWQAPSREEHSLDAPSDWPGPDAPAAGHGPTPPRPGTPAAVPPTPGYDLSAMQQPGAPFSQPPEPSDDSLPGETQRESMGSEPLDLELPDLSPPEAGHATPSRQPSETSAPRPSSGSEAFDLDNTALYGRDGSATAQPDQPPAQKAAGPSRPSPPVDDAVPFAARTPQPPVHYPVEEPSRPASGLAPASETSGMETALAALLQGAGAPGLPVQHGASPETFRAIGELLALYAGGSAELLRLIGNIKNTFRINQTQIRQRENNPLRWVASPREAVRRLLAPEDDGYLAPREAVVDAIASIKAHQMSSIHGMQEAFKAFLNELDPGELENRFDRQGRPGPLTNKGAWYWARYADYHRQLLEDAENNVLDLIGSAFSTAYEQQVQNVRKQRNGHR